MGTQQILLIVLSVIIVGIAVAVGITMFNQQAFTSNRSACISDMNMFAQQAQAWYKTPPTHGGKGSGTIVPATDLDDLVEWIGFSDNATGEYELATGNGQFDLALTATTLTITANGNEPSVDPQLVLTFADGDTDVTIDTTSS